MSVRNQFGYHGSQDFSLAARKRRLFQGPFSSSLRSQVCLMKGHVEVRQTGKVLVVNPGPGLGVLSKTGGRVGASLLEFFRFGTATFC